MLRSEQVQICAEAAGVSRLSQGVLDAVAHSTETRLRRIIQSAHEFTKHAGRSRLTTADIDRALRVHNVPAVYGHSGDGPGTQYRQASEDVFFAEDRVLSLEAILDQPLPPCPVEPTFSVHWLAVDGVQPSIAQNPVAERSPAPSPAAAGTPGDQPSRAARRRPAQRAPAPVYKPAVRHTLSQEQQLFFKHVTDAVKGDDHVLREAALHTLRTQAGLHQLLPYFTQFVADEVAHNLRNLRLLGALMGVSESLLRSEHLHIEPYLHQLMPAILTCLVGKRLGSSPTEDHWNLRDRAASLVAYVCHQFGRHYTTLQPRVSRTLAQAFLDPSRSLPTHYGAVVGLHKLGPATIRALVLPYVRMYLSLLEPEMTSSQHPAKASEAEHVYGALLAACGSYIRSELKSGGSGDSMQEEEEDQEEVESTLPAFAPSARARATAGRAKQPPAKKAKTGKHGGKKRGGEEQEKQQQQHAGGVPPAFGAGYPRLGELLELFGEALLPYTQVSRRPNRALGFLETFV